MSKIMLFLTCMKVQTFLLENRSISVLLGNTSLCRPTVTPRIEVYYILSGGSHNQVSTDAGPHDGSGVKQKKSFTSEKRLN